MDSMNSVPYPSVFILIRVLIRCLCLVIKANKLSINAMMTGAKIGQLLRFDISRFTYRFAEGF